MKRMIPGVLIFLAACADGGIAPLEIGGDGVRFMNGTPGSASQAYDQAYAWIPPQHRRVYAGLKDARRQSVPAALGAVEKIIQCLETMKACVVDSSKPMFDPYIARYKGWHDDLDRNTWGGGFMTDFEHSEREVRIKFAPGRMEIVATPAVPPPAPVSFRLSYKAWDRAHDDLLKLYREKKDCAAAYKDLSEALALMMGQITGKRAELLTIYTAYYADIHDRTLTFTVLPGKTTGEEIAAELEVAARVLRKELNPDKP